MDRDKLIQNIHREVENIQHEFIEYFFTKYELDLERYLMHSGYKEYLEVEQRLRFVGHIEGNVLQLYIYFKDFVSVGTFTYSIDPITKDVKITKDIKEIVL